MSMQPAAPTADPGTAQPAPVPAPPSPPAAEAVGSATTESAPAASSPQPAVAPARAPRVVSSGTDGTPIDIGPVPQTAEQLAGMRVRREELKDLLGEAERKRDELREEYAGSMEGLRPGIQLRIDRVDARILELERAISAVDARMTSAPAELLATLEEQERQRRESDDDEEAVLAAGAMFGVGILGTLVVQRVRALWRSRRARRRGEPTGERALALDAEEARFAQLAQSVEAIALEVERIGEGQRFVTQLLAEERQASALGRGEPRGGGYPGR